MKLLVGSQNEAKHADFSRVLIHNLKKHNVDIEIFYPQDVGVFEDPEETGTTFEENSLLKAKFYFDKTGIPTLADDGGIIIPILGEGVPGVYSRRWAGEHATDAEIIAHTLKKLEPFPNIKDRTAFFVACITYYDGSQVITEFGKVKGHIALDVRPGEIPKKFPYRSLFVEENGKYYEDLTHEEHAKYNQREIALSKIFDRIVAL